MIIIYRPTCSYILIYQVLDQNLRRQEPLSLHLTLKYHPDNVDKVMLNVTKVSITSIKIWYKLGAVFMSVISQGQDKLM